MNKISFIYTIFINNKGYLCCFWNFNSLRNYAKLADFIVTWRRVNILRPQVCLNLYKSLYKPNVSKYFDNTRIIILKNSLSLFFKILYESIDNLLT